MNVAVVAEEIEVGCLYNASAVNRVVYACFCKAYYVKILC